jgi:geranylgeranyl reductase family protein
MPDSQLYDVAIVGAGPSGATCAFYLARQGKRVLLLERKKFPRDKLCGDAVCTSAQTHLRRMGVLQEILAEGKGHWAEVGGLVSPRGFSFVGNSAKHTGGSLVIAIKRMVLDEKVARAAQKAGAHLVENFAVTQTEFSPANGTWSIHQQKNGKPPYRARVLVACDGASSTLARSLGLVRTPPDAVCSRAYIKAGTFDFAADGVVFYPREVLPGYCALFREARGELNFACYILPGGRCTSADLQRVHEQLFYHDPHIRAALGPRAEPERMRGAGLRLGGIPRSYADHLLVVGDAAGHIDPLTGEGIHHAMDAAEIAAQTLDEAFAAGDFRASFLKRYQKRWHRRFGRDFAWSRRMARLSAKFPIFIDACAAVSKKRGPEFLAQWAAVMTGARPKRHFFRPGVIGPLLWEAGRQWLKRSPSPVGHECGELVSRGESR